MSALPFSDFLELLRARGLGVGLHEHLAVGRLLEHWHSTNRTELRDALAALVARHEGEVETIRGLFDECYPPDDAIDRDSGAGKPRTYRLIGLLDSRRGWAAGMAALVLTSAIGYAAYYYANVAIPPPPLPPLATPVALGPLAVPEPDAPLPDAVPVLPEALIQQAPAPPAAQLAPPAGRVNWPWLLGLSGLALIVALVALWSSRIRASARQWTVDAWQKALASLPGPFHSRMVLRDLHTRLPRRDIEDAATLLARAFSGMGLGEDLDVRLSLQRTLRSGMRPQLIFKPRRIQQAILVLQDTAQVMRVYTERVDAFVTDLRRQGVVLDRWYFDGDVRYASHRPNGPLVALEVLARRNEDRPVLIVSSGFGLSATLTAADRAWQQALRTWARRVWLSPIRDPAQWPDALGRIPIRVLPMTRDGLLEAARVLAQDRYDVGSVARTRVDDVVPVTMGHVATLRQLASVVPYPTAAELELLRQRFAPAVPEGAVLHVATDLRAYEGAQIRMSDGDIRSHLHDLRRERPGLEVEVRRYLMKVLADSEPVAGSAAHLRWELSRALHQAQIDRLTGGDATAALAELSRLARGPVWRELREAIERLEPAGRDAGALRKAAGVDKPGSVPAFHDDTGLVQPLPFHWRPPHWRDAVGATAVAVVVLLAGVVSGMPRVQPMHILDAYRLDYQASADASRPGVLRVTTRDPTSGVPATVQVYRDTLPYGAAITIDGADGGTIQLEAGSAAHFYQARAAHPGGGLALSNTIWAPSVVIVIDAQPWARVTVRSTDGAVPDLEQLSPAAFRLPEGRYDVHLENDGLTGPLDNQIEISVDGPRTFRFDMPGFDPNDALGQLGLDAPAAAAY